MITDVCRLANNLRPSATTLQYLTHTSALLQPVEYLWIKFKKTAMYHYLNFIYYFSSYAINIIIIIICLFFAHLLL